MKKIALTQGLFALVDDADYEWLNQWKWIANRMKTHHILYYAVRGIPVAKGKQGDEKMHRLILGLQPGDKRECDHKDGDGLNNQQSNLRICTRMQNQQNQRKQKSGSSKHKGVSWNRDRHKWRSRIQVNRKLIHLGYFPSEKTAGVAYNQAAQKHFGEFARLNTL